MIRKFLVILLAGAIILSFAGCGKNSQEQEDVLSKPVEFDLAELKGIWQFEIGTEALEFDAQYRNYDFIIYETDSFAVSDRVSGLVAHADNAETVLELYSLRDPEDQHVRMLNDPMIVIDNKTLCELVIVGIEETYDAKSGPLYRQRITDIIRQVFARYAQQFVPFRASNTFLYTENGRFNLTAGGIDLGEIDPENITEEQYIEWLFEVFFAHSSYEKYGIHIGFHDDELTYKTGKTFQEMLLESIYEVGIPTDRFWATDEIIEAVIHGAYSDFFNYARMQFSGPTDNYAKMFGDGMVEWWTQGYGEEPDQLMIWGSIFYADPDERTQMHYMAPLFFVGLTDLEEDEEPTIESA